MTYPVLMIGTPLLFLALMWVIGKLVLNFTEPDFRESEGYAVFIGIGVILAIVSNFSFLGVPIDSAIVYLVIPVFLLVLYKKYEIFKDINFKQLLAMGLVVLITSAHFLVPNIVANGAPIALVEAGDFNSYISVGSWLQIHPISSPNNYHLASGEWNVIDANIDNFQTHSIRLGSTFLLAYFGNLFGSDLTDIYSVFVAMLVSLSALGIFVFSSSILRRTAENNSTSAPSILAPCLIGILYGISPVTVWSGYAAFLPQVMGLAFCLVILSSLSPLSDLPKINENLKTGSIFFGNQSIVWRALLIFSGWITYPEAFPLLFVILLFSIFLSNYPLLKNEKIGLIAAILKSSAIYAVFLIVLFIVISPRGFIYGIHGLIKMMQNLPHGGEQLASPMNLMAVMLGLSAMPLVKGILSSLQNWYLIGPVFFLACLGIFHAARRSASRPLVVAVGISCMLLFSYISCRYGNLQTVTGAEALTIITWNYFKAAQYLSPFVFSVAFTGLFIFFTRFNRVLRGVLALSLVAIFSHIASQNDQRFLKDAVMVESSSRIAKEVIGLPHGRILVDLEKADYQERYALYSALVSRSFISTKDVQHHCLRIGNCTKNRFLDQPISFVLTDHFNHENSGKVIFQFGKYTILDVRDTFFAFSIKDLAGNAAHLISNSTGKFVNSPHLALYNLLGQPAEIALGSKIYQVSPNDNAAAFLKMSDMPITHGLSQIHIKSKSSMIEIAAFTSEVGPELISVRDLLPGLMQIPASSDANGNKISVFKSPEGTTLEMAKPGDSRLLLSVDLDPGTYFVQLGIRNVSTEKSTGVAGFGAYFGVDNDFGRSFELTGKQQDNIFYRFVHDGKNGAIAHFSLGIGGWGKAKGTISLDKLHIYKVKTIQNLTHKGSMHEN